MISTTPQSNTGAADNNTGRGVLVHVQTFSQRKHGGEGSNNQIPSKPDVISLSSQPDGGIHILG